MGQNYYNQISKVKKKIILRYYRKYYQTPSGVPPESIRNMYENNPNEGLLHWGLFRASQKYVELEEEVEFFDLIWAWDKFCNRNESLIHKIFHRVYPTGGKRLSHTLAMTLLMERGFRHIMDVRPYLDRSLYSVYSNQLPLVYPAQFELHQDALIFGNKFGLPNFTTCPALDLQKVLYTRNY